MTSRNVVDNPILNSPFAEPSLHYDFSGPTPRAIEGRRLAGYYGMLRSDRMGDGALAEHPFFPLPVVNEIRARVAAWRKKGYPNITRVTRDLLEHWNRAERRPLFFCQREAVETVIWLVEATPADRQGLEIPVDEPKDLESARRGYQPLRRCCAKMATGSGKTTVMAMIAAWSIANKATSRNDSRFTDHILVVGPNLTIKQRLRVLDPRTPGNYYEAFDLIPPGYRDILSQGRVFVTNWHIFHVRDDSNRRGIVQRGRESDSAFVRRVLGKDLGKSAQLLVLNDEAHHAYRPAPPASESEAGRFAGMSAEERKDAEEFAEEATIWVGGLDRIHKVRGIKLVVDLSATPFYLKGTGYPEGAPLPWIVSDFGLVDAIESGITKVPRVPVADDSGRPDPKYFYLWRHIMEKLPQGERETQKRKAKPEAVFREAQGALVTLAGKWEQTKEYFEACGYPVPPALIVVAASTALAEEVARALKNGDVIDDLKGDSTFAIDSKVLAEAEAADESSTKNVAQERLRLTTATVGKASWPDDKAPEGWEHLAEPPGKHVRCVVSVGMLTEGWDAQNVTQILGLRAFSSQLLCEQVVGRGLRRMSYALDEATGMLAPEYCDVFGIPFEVIPVQGSYQRRAAMPPPSTLVEALDERKHLMIEFPRVEGYIVDLRQHLKCDVEKVQPLVIEPHVEPTAVLVRTQMGWVVGKVGVSTSMGAGETLTRERFYQEHRLQRTLYEMAREITEVFAGGRVTMGKQPKVERRLEAARLLFPQVLAVVAAYIERRVTLSSPNARIEEVALARYRDLIIERLVASIEIDDPKGPPALLPRIERHRPVGSTAEVQFRTTRQVTGTLKSHISHVTLDSTWENSAAFYLEQSHRVVSYAKNDRLDFHILYEWNGNTHTYIPDFLARLDDGTTWIIEIKGHETEQDRAKQTGADKWVRAVNHHGGFGMWKYVVCKDANEVGRRLQRLSDKVASPELSGGESIEGEVREFLNSLSALREHPRKAVRHAFSFLDEALLAGKLDVCDLVLQLAEPRRLDVTTATGLLAVTLQARGMLRHRDDYYTKVEVWLREVRPDDVEGLLEGLR